MIRLFLLLLSASASLAQSLPYNTDNRLLADTSLSLPAWDTHPAYKGSETTLIQDFTDQFHIPPICYKLNLETCVVTAAVKQAAAHEKWK